ncbi:arginine metabolism regulation protein II [Purpureocillium lavendulum]|uniref:Arginine metabolism regulation protein II n=1 Tax=Purpureocillium lavendulum TaxID=1247861 RepID=A0AB34FRX6_9HYPO|nr:arginine metabolism regulation protein II [Purpureocillium lavendulum]
MREGKGTAGLVKGPFAVFDACEKLDLEPHKLFSDSAHSSASEVRRHRDDLACDQVTESQPWTNNIEDLDLFETFIDEPPVAAFGQHEDGTNNEPLLLEFSFSSSLIDDSRATHDALSEVNVSLDPHDFETVALDTGFQSKEDSNLLNYMYQERPHLSFGPGLGNASGVPEHAESLLRFYKSCLDSTKSVTSTKRKSPWQDIFLPCALQTYSELLLWNTTSRTHSAILSALLAYSAFLLYRSRTVGNCNDRWLDAGVRNLRDAQTNIRIALQSEMAGHKRAKYKELLMATLAVAVISLHQSVQSFRFYLFKAERLIRNAGLDRCHPQSSARILHHMYTHLRVIAESISCRSTSPHIRAHEGAMMEISDTFRLAQDSLNAGLNGELEKPEQLGLRDIHLQTQGRWTQTWYPAIYGIPESLMTLFSQTVSLANDKARLDLLARSCQETSSALSLHVKTLEDSIWAWSLSSPTDDGAVRPVRPPELQQDDERGLLDHPQAQHMALAIHQALIMYFYRRIHNPNAMILQDSVRRTLDYLEACMDGLVDDQDFGPTLAWTALIAACEAVVPDLQERAIRCLETTDNRGFYFTPKPGKELVALIWERRKHGSTNWAETMAEMLS